MNKFAKFLFMLVSLLLCRGFAVEATPTYLASGYYPGGEVVNPYQELIGTKFVLSSYYVRGGVHLDQEFTFQKMIQTVRDKNITSIESLIDILPANMKNSNYVLMYRSRSLQEASPEAPRAILYTPTASFILSFNGGDPSMRGSQTVETIQFDQKTNRFEFRELTFDGVNQPHISEANPAKCLECHQSATRQGVDMRPNWEPYSSWVGAYGSNDGYFSTRTMRTKLKGKILPQDDEALDQQEHEADFYNDYANRVAPKHPRYSRLGTFTVHSTVDLSEHITIWNMKRVVRLITEQPRVYEIYRELFAWMAACPLTTEDFKDNAVLRWHWQFKYPQYYDYSPFPYKNVSAILTQLFEPLGIDTSDWSTDFADGGRFAFYERFGTPSNNVPMLKFGWYLVAPGADEMLQRSCDDLKSTGLAKVQAAISSGEVLKLRQRLEPPAPKASDILSRCMACHEDPNRDAGIPFIPFDQPAQLAQKLKTQSKTHLQRTLFEEIEYRSSDMAIQKDQMPPSHRLSAKEHNTLIRYLKDLAD